MITQPKPKEIKWQPQHFPVGTVVELADWTSSLLHRTRTLDSDSLENDAQDPLHITVVSVVQNGIDSYVLVSDLFNADLDMPYSFNMTHVTRILKRGDGPEKIVPQLSCVLNLARSRPYFLPASYVLNKNRYYWTNVESIIARLFAYSHVPKHLGLRPEFEQFFLRQTFVKKETVRGTWYDREFMFSVDKKKAKKWFGQNVNRWIMPIKEALEIEHADQKAEYDRYLHDEMEGATYRRVVLCL